MKTYTTLLAATALGLIGAPACIARDAPSEPLRRADETLRKMRPEEKTILTHGTMPLEILPNSPKPPADAVPGAGYVPGIPRLGIPALKETDASLGVTWIGGMRGNDEGATAMPSGLAQASTWNPGLLEEGGRMIGSEARSKGYNVLLAGGVNLARDPRNGRNFEYLGEDPLLAGTLVGHIIRGVQSNHIISTIKHFALNGQETARRTVNSRISAANAHESDLLAFKIGLEIGQPGAVMCAYNQVNAAYACDNPWLLDQVLKQEWRYPGYVMSDWGAVPGVGASLHGLDQQSGAELDASLYFGDALGAQARTDPAYARRLDDMNRRILYAIYANGLDAHPVSGPLPIDFAAHGRIAQNVAEQGIVLLKNTGDILPLAASAKRIAVIGGYATNGVLTGGGSSEVQASGGPAVRIPLATEDPFSASLAVSYQKTDPTPFAALRALAPKADFHFRTGRYITEAVAQAKKADIAIVFATQWSTEGLDQPDLSLPNGQDALIAAVAAANPRTIVVLQTGGPVAMPWLDQTAAVIEAWYPGAHGGAAIANVLFGKVNPSGHLPLTFPASLQDLPRPRIDGFDDVEPSFLGKPDASLAISVDYDIEGSDVGYRWDAREGKTALFPFGFGLSYTTFSNGPLSIDGRTAQASVTNTGTRPGADVVQLYLVTRQGRPIRRLAGFARIELNPGQTGQVSMTIDPRILGEWQDGYWSMPAGEYGFSLGRDAEKPGPVTTIKLPARTWRN